MLGVNESILRTIAGSASSQYMDFEVAKKDGSKRQVSAPKHFLKVLQKRINRHIFEQVEYADYLFGGIKGRDYVQNAKQHSGASATISLDIENFFPNISQKTVFNIFKNFFKQPEEVAELLSNICTKNGTVPQGACTSTYIANLAFHELEPRLFTALCGEGLKYTRLIDDITISSTCEISKKRSSKIIERVSALLKSGGFKLKGKKTKVSSASNPEQLMEVTGLWLNRGKPRVKKDERILARKEFRQCQSEFKINRQSPEYHALHERVSGKSAKLAQLGHHEAAVYRKKLRQTLPHHSPSDMRKTRIMVAKMSKTPKATRGEYAYIERYHQILYRINIAARSQPEYAEQLRAKLKTCKPTRTKDASIHD